VNIPCKFHHDCSSRSWDIVVTNLSRRTNEGTKWWTDSRKTLISSMAIFMPSSPNSKETLQVTTEACFTAFLSPNIKSSPSKSQRKPQINKLINKVCKFRKTRVLSCATCWCLMKLVSNKNDRPHVSHWKLRSQWCTFLWCSKKLFWRVNSAGHFEHLKMHVQKDLNSNTLCWISEMFTICKSIKKFTH